MFKGWTRLKPKNEKSVLHKYDKHGIGTINVVVGTLYTPLENMSRRLLTIFQLPIYFPLLPPNLPPIKYLLTISMMMMQFFPSTLLF